MLVRLKQAEEMTGLARRALRKYIDTGAIRGVIIGKERRVPMAEIKRFIRLGLRKTKETTPHD